MSKKIKVVSLIIFSLVMSFVAAEMFFRYLYPKIAPFDDRIAVRYASPYTMFSKFDYGTPESPKPAGEFRLFMLGGSTVEHGNPPLPVLVEKELKRRGLENVRVFNYGIISQNSSQELAHLVFHVLDSGPDMVVMYNGGNDIMDPLLYDPRPGYPFNFLAYENNVLFKDYREYPWPALLAYGSEMLRHLFRGYFFEKFGNFSFLRMDVDYGTDAWSEKTARIYAGNLAKAARICNAYDVQFASFFQPLEFYTSHDVAGEKKHLLKEWPPVEANLVLPYTEDVRARILRRVKDEQRQFAFAFHDLSDIFDKSNNAVFTDYIHINAEANQRIASAICDRLTVVIGKSSRQDNRNKLFPEGDP
jgi:lysophospholipase L1-like esterase